MAMAGTGAQEEAMDSSDKVPVQVSRRVSLRRRVLEYNLVQLQARQLAMQERDIQIRNNYERLRTSRQNLIAACDDEGDDNEDGDNEASDVEVDQNRHRRRSKRHAKASGFFRTLTKKLRHADCSSGRRTSTSPEGGEYENKQSVQEFKMAAPNCEVAMDDRSAPTSCEMPGLVRSQAVMNLSSQLQNLKDASTSLDESLPSIRRNKENVTSDSEDVEMDFSSTIPPTPAQTHNNPPQRSSSLCLTPKSKPCKITKHRSLRLPSMLRCKPRVYDHVTAEISPPPSKKGKHELSLSAPEYTCYGNGKSYSVPAAPLPRRRALSVKFTPVQWKDIS